MTPLRSALNISLYSPSAAVDTSWSTGQVEGQINRLKTIKRQMYGRAGLELLRARVLPYSPAASPGPGHDADSGAIGPVIPVGIGPRFRWDLVQDSGGKWSSF